MAGIFPSRDAPSLFPSSLKCEQQESPLLQSPTRGRLAKTPALSPPSLRKLLSKQTCSNAVQPEYIPIQDSRPLPKTDKRSLRVRQSSPCTAKQGLIEDYESRKTAAICFPPTFSNHCTRLAIRQFQSYVDNVVASTKDICASCGLFILSGNLKRLHHSHPILLSAFESHILVALDLDYCGKREHYLNFYMTCYRQIIKSKPSKFGSTSQINVCICQNYPNALNNLTLVEEAVIARAHPVISILKLRPAGASFSASYQQVRGYAVVLLENPGPLLTLLPFSSLELHDIIQVVWARKRPYTKGNIYLFGRVRKNKILEALIWLRENNPLYGDIDINHTLLDNWADEFVPTGIVNCVLQCDPDSEEREGYATNLESDNYKNELYYAVNDAGLNDSGLLSGCLYTDADDAREHPTMKLVSAVTNYKRGTALTDNVDLPILTYKNSERPIPRNDWENPN